MNNFVKTGSHDAPYAQNAYGALTLTYAELDGNNEVEIQYIANAAVKRLAEKEIEVIEPVKVVVATDGKTEKVEGTGGEVSLS